jgi:protein import protein ZIM17
MLRNFVARAINQFSRNARYSHTLIQKPPQLLRHNAVINHRALSRNYSEHQQTLGKIESGKLSLSFKCKVCDTRNSYIISKKAYTEGVVLVECQGCKNNHLIADNLKWFRDGKTNIEDLMREKGETVRKMSLNNVLELTNE